MGIARDGSAASCCAGAFGRAAGRTGTRRWSWTCAGASLSPQRPQLRVEGEIDQDVGVEVDLPVQVEVAVEPAGPVVIETAIGAHVVVEVDPTVEFVSP